MANKVEFIEPKLADFLKKRGVLELFLGFCDTCFDADYICPDLITAFDWANTKKGRWYGREFWDEINNEYEEYLLSLQRKSK